MASGVKITDDVKSSYNEVTMTTKKKNKLKYAVYKFSDDVKQIILDSKCDESESQDNDIDALFAEILPPNDVRYIAYDYKHLNKDGTAKSSIVFVSWNPEGCPVKKKMLLASSLNSLRSSLGLGKNVIEAGDMSECNSEAILEKIGGLRLDRSPKDFGNLSQMGVTKEPDFSSRKIGQVVDSSPSTKGLQQTSFSKPDFTKGAHPKKGGFVTPAQMDTAFERFTVTDKKEIDLPEEKGQYDAEECGGQVTSGDLE